MNPRHTAPSVVAFMVNNIKTTMCILSPISSPNKPPLVVKFQSYQLTNSINNLKENSDSREVPPLLFVGNPPKSNIFPLCHPTIQTPILLIFYSGTIWLYHLILSNSPPSGYPVLMNSPKIVLSYTHSDTIFVCLHMEVPIICSPKI